MNTETNSHAPVHPTAPATKKPLTTGEKVIAQAPCSFGNQIFLTACMSNVASNPSPPAKGRFFYNAETQRSKGAKDL